MSEEDVRPPTMSESFEELRRELAQTATGLERAEADRDSLNGYVTQLEIEVADLEAKLHALTEAIEMHRKTQPRLKSVKERDAPLYAALDGTMERT